MTAAGRAIVPDSRGGNHHSRRFMQPVDRFHQLAGGHDAALHQLPLVGIRPAPVDGRSGQIDDGMASRQGLRQTIHALLGKQIAPQGRHPMPEHLKTLGQMTPYKSAGSRNGYIHHLNPNGGPPPRRRSGTSPESPPRNRQPLPDKTFPALPCVQKRTYFAAFPLPERIFSVEHFSRPHRKR